VMVAMVAGKPFFFPLWFCLSFLYYVITVICFPWPDEQWIKGSFIGGV